MALPRFLMAFVLSVVITTGLFYLMQALIASGDATLTEPPKGSVLDFVRVKQREAQEKRIPIAGYRFFFAFLLSSVSIECLL